MNRSDTFLVKCEFTSDEREWSAKAVWTGWRRVIGFGAVVNVMAPAVTLWVAGWQIMLGRLQKRHSVTELVGGKS